MSATTQKPTTDQSARIEAPTDELHHRVGVKDGSPLVRQASGEVPLLDSDRRLAPAEHGVPKCWF